MTKKRPAPKATTKSLPGPPARRFHTLLRGKFFTVLLMLIAWLAAVLIRLEDLPEWRDAKQRAFLDDGTPVLIEPDGYHYLRHGRDLASGQYGRIDTLRNVPELVTRPWLPPLLSLLAGGLMALTKANPEWIAAIVPVVVASLIVVPVFLLGRSQGGRGCGFVSACVAALSPGFVGRSQFGRFDTDCGNVVLLAFCAWLAFEMTSRPWRARGRWLAAFVATVLLWLWWWDTARGIVLALCFGIFATTLVTCIGRHAQRWGLSAVALLLVGGALALSSGWDVFPFNKLSLFVAQLSDSQSVISEKKKIDMVMLARGLTGGYPGLVMAVAGLVFMAWKERMKFLTLCIPVALAALPFVWFERFIVFGAPVAGWGVGYAVCSIATWGLGLNQKIAQSWRAWFSRLLAMGCAVVVMWMDVQGLRSFTNWPMLHPSDVMGMKQIDSLLPANAVVWSWWDNGYHLMYYGRRGTIEDGGWLRMPEINAVPVTTGNERFAANWMSYVATRGREPLIRMERKLGKDGVREVLSRGPVDAAAWLGEQGVPNVQDVIAEMFPAEGERKDVYLYVNNLYLPTAHWWYWYGAASAGLPVEHPYVVPMLGVREENGRIVASGGVQVDLGRGAILINGVEFALKEAVVKRGNQAKGHQYGNASNLRFQWNQDEYWALLCDEKFAATLFNSLYFLPQEPRPHFKNVMTRTPAFQLWQVVPDASLSCTPFFYMK